MPKLLIKNGERKGSMIRVGDQKLELGRDPSNTVVIPDRRVSRRHASIFSQAGEWWIEDLGSVNGTFVNGQAVRKGKLQFCDQIMLGATVIEFLQLNAPEDRQTDGLTQVRLLSAQENVSKSNVVMSLSTASGSFEKKDFPADPKSLLELYQRLLTVYRISLDLGVVVDLKKLSFRILESVLNVIKADRGFIMLQDKETQQLILQAVYRRPGVDESEEISLSQTIAQQVMHSGESLLISDAGLDERFKQAQSIVIQGIRSTMCVPIKIKDRILGILYVDTKGKVASFVREDLEMLTAISHQAAVAIENSQLFDNLHKVNEELKQQQAQLIESEKLSALGQLAGGVAHEINNPMTSILGYSQLIVGQLGKENLDAHKIKECAEFAGIVESEAHRCQAIVQTLLQFGRRKKEEMVAMDVNKAIEAALLIAKFHIKKTHIEIKQQLSSGLPAIMADANQLQQVFLNLIINARDAMEKNGGTLLISSCDSAEGHVIVKFADTGCGIPEDKLDEIFKPLYTTKEEGKGTGLGLSITQDILELHKAKIEVESTVGKGTTFTIRFPVIGG